MTIFSDWVTGDGRTELCGLLQHFGALELPPESDIDAEWFVWMLDELIAERNCYLIIEKRFRDPYGYVQFAAGPGGQLIAETQSNEFLVDQHRLSHRQEHALVDFGWNPPNCAWPPTKNSVAFESPNFFRSFVAPAPTSEVALLALRTLRDIYGTIRVRDYDFAFFRRRNRLWDGPERRR
jgi:hypothetical protein